ncbi:MAG: leucine--tRNA ligase [Fimbriimonadales bacterium]
MPNRYEPTSFEQKWRDRWREAGLFKTRESSRDRKFYGLDFFPYPSGAGLSVGHLRNYIPTDVLCRMKAMMGYDVLHPMGWDAFGLPAENEAIAKQVNPAPMVREYAATYKRQMNLIGISYDWDREQNSSDPDYYRWTQWIFLLLFKKGLAYHGDYPANWCPVDKTVLANEEVEGGLCWRCGTAVEKKILKQWFFRITAYAQQLIDDLDTIEWPEGIKMMQRNWIGRSQGVEFDWKVVSAEGSNGERANLPDSRSFRVFTTRIDTVYGATFCVLAPEHPLVSLITSESRQAEVNGYVAAAKQMSETDRLATTHEKTGVFIGAYAKNPFTGAEVPIFIADYVLMGYGTGAIMAVPAHDDRDFAFATKFGLPIPQVIAPLNGESPDLPFTADDGKLINSGEFDGLGCSEAQSKMAEKLEAAGEGSRKVNYRLRDWLISRQRYWGCPIPIVHCQSCGAVPVAESDLPIELPQVEHYQPTSSGESPLAGIESFVNVACPKCGAPAKRETDTMGGFACSSWYFLRFCDPRNATSAFSPEKVSHWMPVDCYVGGAEHAVMHLLYARFWTKVLYDEGLLPMKEPFAVLHNQGMLLAPTPFRKPREGETLRVGEEGIQISYEEARDLPDSDLFWRWTRMSKSKGNVVTPDEGVEKFGADAIRVYELFEAPFEQTIQWTEDRVMGAVRFLNRVFKMCDEAKPRFVAEWRNAIATAEFTEQDRDLRFLTHSTIKRVTQDIEQFAFNTAVAALMEYLNGINDSMKRGVSDIVLSEAIQTFVTLLAPIAPHSSDEIWESYGQSGFTYGLTWPTADEGCLKRDTVTVVLQVNGKMRGNMLVAQGLPNESLQQLALQHEKVLQHVQSLTIRKVIVVPDKLVNIVAN